MHAHQVIPIFSLFLLIFSIFFSTAFLIRRFQSRNKFQTRSLSKLRKSQRFYHSSSYTHKSSIFSIHNKLFMNILLKFIILKYLNALGIINIQAMQRFVSLPTFQILSSIYYILYIVKSSIYYPFKISVAQYTRILSLAFSGNAALGGLYYPGPFADGCRPLVSLPVLSLPPSGPSLVHHSRLRLGTRPPRRHPARGEKHPQTDRELSVRSLKLILFF